MAWLRKGEAGTEARARTTPFPAKSVCEVTVIGKAQVQSKIREVPSAAGQSICSNVQPEAADGSDANSCRRSGGRRAKDDTGNTRDPARAGRESEALVAFR